MRRYQFGLMFFLAIITVTLSVPLYFNGVIPQRQASAQQEAGSAEGVAVSEDRLHALVQVQKNNEADLFKISGVVGVGIGLGEKGVGLAIHVYLNEDNPNASVTAIPQRVDGVAVRVLQTDEIRALDGPPGNNHRLNYPNPVPMGVSTSNVNGIFAGTLGFRVFRIGQTSNVGYITNNHVAAANGANLCPLQVNPQRLPAFGVDQCQPGRLDAGGACTPPVIGDLVQAVPIVMSTAFHNTIDAAFVQSSRSLVNKTILDIGNPSPTTIEPAVGASVRKSGRTTGLTTGTIQTINAAVNVGYGASCGVARFIGQIIITPGSFSAAGDSGSPILRNVLDAAGRRRPVGLLFAGSSTITVANRIADVLGALHAQIDTL
jgi:hypothetical protein